MSRQGGEIEVTPKKGGWKNNETFKIFSAEAGYLWLETPWDICSIVAIGLPRETSEDSCHDKLFKISETISLAGENMWHCIVAIGWMGNKGGLVSWQGGGLRSLVCSVGSRWVNPSSVSSSCTSAAASSSSATTLCPWKRSGSGRRKQDMMSLFEELLLLSESFHRFIIISLLSQV